MPAFQALSNAAGPLQAAKADKDSVQAFLRAIQFSRIKEFESENPDSLELYGLKNPTKSLILKDENKNIYSINLGNSKPGSGTFAKKEEAPGVFIDDAKLNAEETVLKALLGDNPSEETKEKFLTVSIGSGYRAHPLQVADQDSFYIIKDHHIVAPPATYDTLDRGDVIDIPTTATSTPHSPKGWKYDLPMGEKVLSPSLTANGHMFFTTFSPKSIGNTVAGCNADIGNAKAYAIAFNPSAPEISSETIITDGPPPAPIELTVSDTGQKAFCLENPGHASCQACEDTNSCPDPDPDEEAECEASVSVILSGTSVISGGADQCDLLKRNYWRSL